MTYEQLLAAVTADPDADTPRVAFADHVRSSDPELARFIELQLASARDRRAQHRGRRHVIAAEDEILLERNRDRWARTLKKYSPEIVFDRGFATKITINPDLFLESGDWLFVLAPIRHVSFVKPPDGGFPIDAIAASPLLARLDSLDVANCGLRDADVARLAASPHLERLRFLDLSWTRLDGSAYEALAASPATRKLLVVLRTGHSLGAPLPGPRYETVDYDGDGMPVMDWTPMTPEGAALEAKHGYIPWLHPPDNDCDAFDAAHYVARGELPVKPPGS